VSRRRRPTPTSRTLAFRSSCLLGTATAGFRAASGLAKREEGCSVVVQNRTPVKRNRYAWPLVASALIAGVFAVLIWIFAS